MTPLRRRANIPRTYFWQLYASWDDETGCHQHVGPVHTLTITPSPPKTSPVPLQDARRQAQGIVL